jgi:uncharacterized membrane protein YeaQ/YmgE (transglycosylase-associated protein family)
MARKSIGKRAGEARPTLLAPEEGGRIMEFAMSVSWVIVGLLAGWLAGIVMKDGGYGLIGDLLLGVFGSVAGGWIALNVSAGGGLFPTVFVAFFGAVIVIVAQREFWAHA